MINQTNVKIFYWNILQHKTDELYWGICIISVIQWSISFTWPYRSSSLMTSHFSRALFFKVISMRCNDEFWKFVENHDYLQQFSYLNFLFSSSSLFRKWWCPEIFIKSSRWRWPMAILINCWVFIVIIYSLILYY